MNPLAHIARAHRMQGHSHNAEADYFAAVGNAEQEAFYRRMAQDYFRMAVEVEAEAMEDAA